MRLKKGKPDEILSLLGEGVDISGEISFSGGLRVDGSVKGKICSETTLLIGPKGNVNAELLVRRVSISGEFHGIIRASDRIEIHREGKVYGDLYTPCLIIEAGALFEGKCNMSDRKTEKAEEGNLLKAVESSLDTGKIASKGGNEKTWIK